MNKACVLTAAGCFLGIGCGGNSNGVTCGTGTALVNGQCIVAGSGGNAGSSSAGDGDASASDSASSPDDGGVGDVIVNACPNPIPPPSPLFEDFENGTLRGWYTYSDKTGTVDPLAAIDVTAGAPGSTKALRLTGSGFMPLATAYGAGTGKVTACTTVAGYEGLSFWARGNTPLTLQITTPRTTPVARFGECPASGRCNDVPVHVFTVTDTWAQYSVTWAQLRQQGFGDVDDFPTRKVIDAIQFEAASAKDAPNGAFELDIDDIRYTQATDDGGP